MLPLVLAAAAGAEPQCPTSGILPCVRRIGDGRFGGAFFPGNLRYDPGAGRSFMATGAPADAVCSRAAYDELHHCGAGGPGLRLTIVEPPEFHTSIPLYSNLPEPWVDEAHIDQKHPAHGKVMDLVGPMDGGDPCNYRKWDYDNVSGQIIVARDRGVCPGIYPSYFTKQLMKNQQLPPPAASLTAFLSGEELFPFAVPATYFEVEDIVSFTAPGVVAFMVDEAAAMGKTLRAKIELRCSDGDAPAAPAAEFTDGCPDDRLLGLCHNMPAPEDRLCTKCPLQLQYAGVKVCAYGSRMYPARTVHFLQATLTVPSAVEVMYVVPPPWGGCRAEDYAGVAGKVVAFPFRFCMGDSAGILNAALLAERQGATGVVFLSHRESWFMLSGPGFRHNVPIHVVRVTEVHAVVAWFEEHGGGANSTLTIELVDEDVAPEPVLPPAPTPAPARLAVAADAASFEATAGAVALIVIVAMLAGAIVGKLVVERRAQVGRQRGSGVPLSVASMLLSVSLLVVVTVIACSLSARAARDATDAAASDGEAAMGLTYRHATDTTARMSSTMLGMALEQVKDSMRRNLQDVEEAALGLQDLFDRWDGSWQGFKDRASVFYGQKVFRQTDVGHLHTGVQTIQGFYFDSKWMTDFTTDESNGMLNDLQSARRADGAYVAGLRSTDFSRTKLAAGGSSFGLEQGPILLWGPEQMGDSPLQRLGGEMVDPVAEAQRLGLGPKEAVWRIASEGIPFINGLQWDMPFVTVSVLVPLFDAAREQFRGAGTAVMDVSNLFQLLWNVKKRKGLFTNMTVVVYDARTEALVGSTNHPDIMSLAETADLFSDGVSMAEHFRALSFSRSVEIGDNALYSFMQERPVSAGGVLEGEFDQRDYYSHPDLHELNVVAGPDGSAVDLARHALPLDMRMGTCGKCVVPDEAFGHAIRFGSGNTLYVDLNLTTDVPYVAAKRAGGGADPWASDDPLYAYAMPIPRTRKQCIYRNTSLNNGNYGCSMRGVLAFTNAMQFTVTARVKPDADVAADEREQRLFEHAAEGDSRVTMYASGALVIGSLHGECEVPGTGVPSGVWTTVTARYDRWYRRCEVWLNGTRIGGQYSSYFPLTVAPSPFAIGNGFVGSMQSIRVFKFLADPESLTAPTFVRNVPSKRWFVRVEHATVAAGLEWVVAVRVPRADVMREVDENNRRLMANLRQQAANTQGKLDRELAEAVLVTAVVVLLSVLVFLVFNDLLTRPFADVSAVMCDAAVMRIEKIPERASFIAELNAMQNATRLMLANLAEYRHFIPPALLAGRQENAYGHMESEVAVVFTDIRNSTSLWGSCQNAMADGLRIHNALIRTRIDEFCGLEVKTIGDAFMVAFPEAADACMFGLCIQQDLMEAEWPEGLLEHEAAARSACGAWNGIKIRVGVNFGTAEVVEERGRVDYFGPVVNVAARVEGQCVPGAVCVTEAAMDAIDVDALGDPVVIEMGERELKGVDGAVWLYLLVPGGMTARATAVRAALDGVSDNQDASNDDANNDTLTERVQRTSVASFSRSNDYSAGRSVWSTSTGSAGARSVAGSWACREFLDRKRCTVARTLFQFPGATLTAAADPVRLVQNALESIQAAVHETHGILHSLFGTTAVLSWQQTRVVEHASNALNYVSHVTEGLKARGTCKTFTGVVTGRLLAGNVGAAGQRFTTVLGSALTLAELLCEGCAALPAAALYASVGGVAALHPRVKRELRPVATWEIEEGDEEAARPKPWTVYQVRLRAPRTGRENPLDAGGSAMRGAWEERKGSVDDAADADWGEEYWRAFENRELDAFASSDPVVNAVRGLERTGGSLRRPVVPLDVLGLYGAEDARRYTLDADDGRVARKVGRD